MEMIEAAHEKMTCDEACLKQREEVELKATWDKTKLTAETAPFREAEAERNYIEYSEGKNAYIQMLEDRYQNVATKWGKDVIKNHVHYAGEMFGLAEDYKALHTLSPRMTELMNVRIKEKKELQKKLHKKKGLAYTDDRLFIYEEREQDGLVPYRQGLMIILYLTLVVFLLRGRFLKDQLYKKWWVWVWIGLYIASPWIVYTISKGLFGLAWWISYLWSNRDHRNVALSY
jgi:hypothetical protein